MSDILKKIINYKKEEIKIYKNKNSESKLFEKIKNAKNFINFKDKINLINSKKKISIIAEIKKASPSAGLLVKDFDPINL